MAIDDDIAQWLLAQPVDQPFEVDGESAYLHVDSAGSELGLLLQPSYTPADLENVLRHGFQSALHFDAGLGTSRDNQGLVLSRWLPGASNWLDAADALEALLNQVDMWRLRLGSGPAKPALHHDNRNEHRLRMIFGATRAAERSA